MDSSLDQSTAAPAPRRGRPLLWRILLALALLLLCGGPAVLITLLDQTALMGQIYVEAISSGNTGVAEALGDHYTDGKDLNQRFYLLDIQRDTGWLKGAEISDLTASREQTLSGQWATIVRFKWRQAESSPQWQDAVLRVKTDSWFFMPYVVAVEYAGP